VAISELRRRAVLEYREGGIALKSQAVLFRSSSHSAQLELELTRRGIPFVKYGGLKFLEAAHIKDVLSVLRWAENPRSRLAGFRTVKLLPGVGSGRLRGCSTPWPRRRARSTRCEASARRLRWPPTGFLCSVVRFAAARGACMAADMDAVTRWYEPHLRRIYEDAYVRQGDLAQLQQIASTLSRASGS